MSYYSAFNLIKENSSNTDPHEIDPKRLGWVAKKHEVGKKGSVHTVSTGEGDKGGVSYGQHQMKSENGWGRVNKKGRIEQSTIADFINRQGYSEEFLNPSFDLFEKNKKVESKPPISSKIEAPKRIGVKKNKDGSESTHRMKTEQLENGTWVGFPSLFQNKDESWVDMSEEKNWMRVYEEAVKRNEVKNFGTDKNSAIKYGEGSWKPKNNLFQLPKEITDFYDNSKKETGREYFEKLVDNAMLVPGSKEFNDKYSEIAKRDPLKFAEEQYKYITETHYDPLAAKFKRSFGIDPNTMSPALREAIYSTGVQHGGYTNLINKALEDLNPKKMNEEDIVKKIYQERGRTDESGGLVHFTKSPGNWNGIKKRYAEEINDVLSLIR